MYICHLITPVATVIVLAIMFIPSVERAILSLVDNYKLGLSIVRLFIVFTTAYVVQLIVDRYCNSTHCLRKTSVSSLPIVISEGDSDKDFSDSKVDEDT